MQKNTMVLFLVTVVMLTGFVSAAPVVSDVVVRQNWPWSRLVYIDYTLSGFENDSPVDIAITAFNGSEELELERSSLSGDLSFMTVDGRYRITWDPTRSQYNYNQALSHFKVELAPIPTTLYMIIDLELTPGDTGHITYLTQPDLESGAWGSWEKDPVQDRSETIKSVIWTGVTNDIAYKTTKLVLRHVPAGTITIYDTNVKTNTTATITRDFYAGVFEVTQKQWLLIYGGNNPAGFQGHALFEARPVEKVSTAHIRGGQTSYGWPYFGHSVDKDSFMGKLGNKTGVEGFDLPTCAQWELACRAGTTTTLNDGDASVPLPIASNQKTNENLNVLGRYEFNGGKTWVWDAGNEVYKWDVPPSDCDPSLGTAIVGSYKPNAWGIYDMHGNVFELCLDYVDAKMIYGGVDPVGPLFQEGNRRARGGSWKHAPNMHGINYNYSYGYTSTYDTLGFRVFLNLD